MKTIFLALVCTLGAHSMINAQRTVEIIGTPNDSYGYLIWKSNLNLVKYHFCDVFLNKLSNGDTISTRVKRTEIWDRSYIKVPVEYLNYTDSTWYSAKVIGITGTNTVAGTEEASFGPIGGSGEEQCRWTCVANDYAYSIVNTKFGNDYNYTLRKAVASHSESGTNVPYYRYFSGTEFEMYTGIGAGSTSSGTGDPALHGFGTADWGQIYNGSIGESDENYASIAMIKFENTPGSNFCDNQGMIIHGTDVYGIQKERWIWSDHPYDWIEDISHDYCGITENLTSMITNMNSFNDIEGRPDLHCYANLAAGCDIGTGGGTDNDNDPPLPDPDCGITFTYGQQEGGSHFPLAPLSVFLCNDDILGDTPSSGGGLIINDDNEVLFGDFLLYTEVFIITSLTHGVENLLYKGGTEFLNSSGSPEVPVLNLSPGLYKVVAKTPNSPLHYIVIEITQPITFSVPQSSFFNAVLYPNPQIDPHYFIDINTSARLVALYEVYDGQGNQLHRQSFDLDVNHDGSHKIIPDNNFPNGMIHHRFTFEDGSHTSYTTLKQ